MLNATETQTRVIFYLKQMRKALPEIKRQLAVYEKAKKEGTLVKNPKPAPQFNND